MDSPKRDLDQPWHTLEANDVLMRLRSDAASGLGSSDIVERVQRYGANELEAATTRGWSQILGDQLREVMVWVLLGAVAISVVVGEYTDALVIVAIVVLNAVLGVVQESKAERSLQALQQLSAPRARVVRDGVESEIPTTEVVPGDIVLLEAGDIVPADLRLLKAADLSLDESSLTGESLPVQKSPGDTLKASVGVGDRTTMAFAGTHVARGHGSGVAVLTGRHTQVGEIARILGGMSEERTPLQARLDQLGKSLAVMVLAVCAVVFIAGWLRGFPLVEMLLTAVSLAVAAIPEGLPAVVTIVLAIGTTNMVRRQVVVRRLRAVETLGSVTVICSDKTGTLTQNRMTVRRFWTTDGYGDVTGPGDAPDGDFRVGEQTLASVDGPLRTLLEVGVLCNDARLERVGNGWEQVGDPTETALLLAAGKADIHRHRLEADRPRRFELAFDSDRKRMSTSHVLPTGGRLIAAKGAPEAILAVCTQILDADGPRDLSEKDRAAIGEVQHVFAEGALRVLALAFRSDGDHAADTEYVEADLVFVGLVGIIDPPRPEARASVEKCRRAGVRPVMITGDHIETAVAIGRELGLADPAADALSNNEIDQLSDVDLQGRVGDIAVFARVSPANKLRIVQALQERGETVAMTGDGVNDGPALKKADIGVAMGVTGTDVARGAADIVLSDDNFASIVAAIEEGRRIFDNIRKFVVYLLSCNVSEVLTILIAVLCGLPQPLLPIHLLWLNLVTDGLPALALGLEPPEPGLMDRPPRSSREGILHRESIRDIQFGASVLTVSTLAAYTHGLYWLCLQPLGYTGWEAVHQALTPSFWRDPAVEAGLVEARTLAFGTLAMGQLVHALNNRSRLRSLISKWVFTNPQILMAVALSAAGQMAVIYSPWMNHVFQTVPITGSSLMIGVGFTAVPLLCAELYKLILRRTQPQPATPQP